MGLFVLFVMTCNEQYAPYRVTTTETNKQTTNIMTNTLTDSIVSVSQASCYLPEDVSNFFELSRQNTIIEAHDQV